MRPSSLLAMLVVGCGSDNAPERVDAPSAPQDTIVDSPADAIELLNGCALAMAVDRTAPGADRTIQFPDEYYAPRCTRIRVGQTVTWTGEFGEHPLAPGILRSNMVIEQPGTPIPTISSGSSASVTFDVEGAWAFYCISHPPGMSGVVYVEP
jgi:plastocyanin